MIPGKLEQLPLCVSLPHTAPSKDPQNVIDTIPPREYVGSVPTKRLPGNIRAMEGEPQRLDRMENLSILATGPRKGFLAFQSLIQKVTVLLQWL